MVARDLIYRFGAFDQMQYVTDTTVSLVCTEADIAYMQNNFALENSNRNEVIMITGLFNFMWLVLKVALGVFIGLYAFVFLIGCIV